MYLKVKVIPNASNNEIVGWEGDFLKIRIQGVAEKGKANNSLISYLSKLFKIPKSSISIVKGEVSRFKTLEIISLQIDDLNNILSN
jgi:hypothetical protein